jgi:hypothetical protein
MYTSEDYEEAETDPDLAHLVAQAHLAYLVEYLSPHDSVYNLALAWRGGPGSVSHPTAEAQDYAHRVVNLVGSGR